MMDSTVNDDSKPSDAPETSASLNVLQLAWRRRSFLILGVVIGGVLGVLYYARATRIYESSARVLVVKKNPEALPSTGGEGRTDNAEDYLSTQQSLLRSPVVVDDAVRHDELDKLSALAHFRDTTREIIDILKVSREMNDDKPTSILNIAFRSSSGEDSAVVVAAVIDSYQRFLQRKYTNVAKETVQLIARASDILEKKLNVKRREYDDFLDHQTALLKGKDNATALKNRLANLENKRSGLLLQEVEAQGRIASLEKALKSGNYNRAELFAMIAQRPRRLGTEGQSPSTMVPAMTMEERLMTLQLQEKTLAEQYGSDHRQLRAVRDELNMLRSRMQHLDGDAVDAQANGTDPVKMRIHTLKLELDSTRVTLKALNERLQEEYRKAEPLQDFLRRDELYRQEIAGSQQLFNSVSKRLDELSALKNFVGSYEAETISPPITGKKVHPKILLAELSDRGFRTPEEVRRRLGLPVVGHIPLFRNAEKEDSAAGVAGLNPSLRAASHPLSPVAEAYRVVRTALYFNCRKDGRSPIIQVTSPDMGDGKSTLISNLGVSIAQSNKKVLLIDADLRRPRLHKLFSLTPKQGLSTLLIGETEIPDAVQTTPIPGPMPPKSAKSSRPWKRASSAS